MKNQFILIVILIASLSTINLKAQNSTSFPKLAIGLSPSSIINLYSGFQASLDIRINDKLNSANEFTYVLGLFDSPGFRAKSGLQYYITDFKRGFLTLGPNLMYQRVTTDVFFYHPMTFSGRANDLKIDFKQNRIAADALGSVRFNLTKKIYMEFGLGAGIHYTTNKVVESTAHNLKSLLAEAPDLKFEEVSNNSTFGLLTSFNLNISVVIEE